MSPVALRGARPPGLDAMAVRADFPLLVQPLAGERLHYLDNAATTHKPTAVIEVIANCYREHYGPVHRGLYPLAEEASRRYEAARVAVARFIGAPTADCVVFTRSATESLNLVAEGWARPRLRPGDEVWVSRHEHHANLLPWQRVCHDVAAKLRFIELDPHGCWDLPRAEREGLFGPCTRIIALSLVSNVLGLRNPVERVVTRARAGGIEVVVDAAQAVAHGPLDVTALGCDFLAFSGHKMYGPDGTGVLYAHPDRLGEIEPLLLGGGMVDQVGEQASTWVRPPARLEAGSANLSGALGLAAAAAYLDGLDRARVQAHQRHLAIKARAALRAVTGVQLYGSDREDLQSGIIAFNMAGIHPHDLAQIAGEQGVALRAGHHCCQPLMRVLGVAATARASFGVYNDGQDIEALVGALTDVRRIFGAPP